jgi:squalene-associated FAD-dependent desaturase
VSEAGTMSTLSNTSQTTATVGIIGGGLAGLAAGCALADAGYKVTLFERKPYLGGRASSYEHPATGEVVDNCQHVLLGCCTNLINFYDRLGVKDKIKWYDKLTFIEPGGRSGTLSPSGIPAPFHASTAFLKFPLLSMRDKLGVAQAMMAVMRGAPKDDGKDFMTWLREHGQTQCALDRFWGPVLVSALNDDLDKVSVTYGAMVFRDAFLKSAEAGRMGVPTVPLSQLYGHAADYIRERGGEVLLRSSVEGFTSDGVRSTVHASGGDLEFDYVVSAVPFHAVERLLPDSTESEHFAAELHGLHTVPITGIHFWFDREVTPLEHAVLLDRTIQWMFQKSKILGRPGIGGPVAAGSYLELVVSSSKTLLEKQRAEIIELAQRELAEFFPSAKDARLLKATVVKEVHATFSPSPGSDAYRLRPQTPWKNIFMSGDWTATGWPATMEGAVRAGYSSAEALVTAAGKPSQFLVTDLEPRGLMKLFPR